MIGERRRETRRDREPIRKVKRREEKTKVERRREMKIRPRT